MSHSEPLRRLVPPPREDVAAARSVTWPRQIWVNGNPPPSASYTFEASKVDISAKAQIRIAAGGSFIKIDPSGVTVFGRMLELN